MAQRRVITEGFDQYPTWSPGSGLGAQALWGVTLSASLTGGRFGGQAARLANYILQSSIYRGIPATNMVSIGFAVKVVDSPTAMKLLYLRDTENNEIISLDISATNALIIRRGSSILAFSDPDIFPSGQWAYVEFAAKLSSSDGTTSVMINGVQVDSLTLTGAGIGGIASIVHFGGIGGSVGAVTFDDIYVEIDGTEHIGEGRVSIVAVNDDVTTDFTPSTGTDNYANVNQIPASTARYNYSNILGARDVFRLNDLDFEPSRIYGVQVTTNATKSETGIRSIKNVLVSGETEELGSELVLAYAANNWCSDFWAKDPDTDEAWTVEGVSGLHIGYEITR